MLSRAIAVNVPEGKIAAGLTALQARYAALEIGSYPYFRQGLAGTTIVTRGFDQAQIDAAAAELKALMVSLGGTPIEEAPPAAEG
jgi:hypothetical protein